MAAGIAVSLAVLALGGAWSGIRVPQEPIRWRTSTAVGHPEHGALRNGVRLPVEGIHHFTWDPGLLRASSRPWRRWGTDRLVRTTLCVIESHRLANPEAPRIGVGDLSLPRGGPFGRGYGGLGHFSHQNGLDVDVYYPRLDRREVRPVRPGQIDGHLSQDLVDRFVAAGAVRVYVGPSTGLRGPLGRGIVRIAPHHDDHMHVRIPRAPPPCQLGARTVARNAGVRTNG